MGMQVNWRALAIELGRPHWLRAGLSDWMRRVSPQPASVAHATAMLRFEVRVCAHAGLWEVRPGIDGPVRLHRNVEAALRDAREIARRAWADEGRLSAVKRLSAEGTWEVDVVFGAACQVAALP